MFLIARELDYDDVLSFCASNKKINELICLDNEIWIYKLNKDFGFQYKNLLSENRNPRDYYAILRTKPVNITLDSNRSLYINSTESILEMATERGFYDLVTFIINDWPKFDRDYKRIIRSAIGYAIMYSNIDLLKFLIPKLITDRKEFYTILKEALIEAFDGYNKDLINFILRDTDLIKNLNQEDWITLFENAVDVGDMELIHLAESKIKDLNIEIYNDAIHGINEEEIFHYFLSRGVNIDKMLTTVIKRKKDKLAKYIVNISKNYNLGLYCSAFMVNLDLIKYMIDRDADVNYGLYGVASSPYREDAIKNVIDYLISKGANQIFLASDMCPMNHIIEDYLQTFL